MEAGGIRSVTAAQRLRLKSLIQALALAVAGPASLRTAPLRTDDDHKNIGAMDRFVDMLPKVFAWRNAFEIPIDGFIAVVLNLAIMNPAGHGFRIRPTIGRSLAST